MRALFYGSVIGAHLVSVHDGPDADGERLFRHLGHVVVKESSICYDRLLGQGLEAGP